TLRSFGHIREEVIRSGKSLQTVLPPGEGQLIRWRFLRVGRANSNDERQRQYYGNSVSWH
ncbi:MAG: hypothetical protein VX893_04610, partial [Candidatus Latescibacterota bacterium]|nr:hypothetical protein [Candidatus Latescibacterota bacterium]